jgi:hypothetical protein
MGIFFEGSFAAVSLRLHCPPPFQPAIGRNKCGWGLDFRLPLRASLRISFQYIAPLATTGRNKMVLILS